MLGALGIELDEAIVATLVESTFAAPAAEYHADVVVELRDAEGALQLIVIVEVQLARDPDKRRSWPTYETLAHARHRADACVLVVSPDPAVARWASTPVDIDKYEYRSDFARKYVAQGRAEGKAEGKAEGRADALLQLLAVRGVSLSDAQRADVLACRDVTTLERWFERAVTARTIDDVLVKD